MKKLFDYDGYFNQVLTKIMYLVSANLLFVLCSIPVITIGASQAAMHTVLMRYYQGDEPDILKTFFQAFKENFRKSTSVWLAMLALAGTLILNFYFLYRLNSSGTNPALVLLYLILFIWLVCWVYFYPVLCYYDNSWFGYTGFIARISIAELPRTVLLIVTALVPVLLCLILAQYSSFGIMLLALGGFSVPAYISEGILLKMFQHYEEKSL